jgi:Legionella pneumophila major outer membrane protein precursor
MNVRALGGCLLTLAALLAGAGLSGAQEPVPSPAGPVTVTTLPHPQFDAPAANCKPGPPAGGMPVLPAGGPFGECTGPVLNGNPFFDPTADLTAGWIFGAELQIVAPHVTGFLIGQVNVGNVFVDTVGLPTPWYDWAGSPRLELGYRFPDSFGEILCSYRFLGTDGWAMLIGLPTGTAWMHGRLDLNSLDIDYAHHESFLGPKWDLKWQAGVRLAGSSYSTWASNFFEVQHANDDFVGAGPHAELDLRWSSGWHGVSLYGRVEGAALGSGIHQHFGEIVNIPDAAPLSGSSSDTHGQVVPVFLVEGGLGWVPWHAWPFHIDAGYQYEVWWNVASAGASTGNLYDQGVFLRAEWNY